MSQPPPRPTREPPKVTEVERYGVEQIPDTDRTSKPFDLFRITFGGANTFATIILGTIPVAFGLSFWASLWATVTGVVVGALILAPMALFGPANGTNNAVSSGAHFGVMGRIVGSFLALLTALAFYSISVWVSGDAFVGGLARTIGLAASDPLRAVVYAGFGLAVIVICVYGYQFMLLVNKVIVIAGTALMLLGVVAYAGSFDPSYPGTPGGYVFGSFGATFVAAVLVTMANPVSFGGFLGDWSRYIPRGTSSRQLMAAPFLAQLCTLIPYLFGVATATLVADPGSYVGGLVGVSPLWYAIPLMVIALLGGMSTGVTSLYGTGLDFSSVFPRLSRVQATLLIGTFAFVFILVGSLVFDVVASINAFATLIILCTSPWMVIMTVGYFVRRGFYRPDDLQVFNRGQRGGVYWFTRGVNWRAMSAWLVAAGLGLSMANTSLIAGPLRNVAGGVDVSLVVALVAAFVVYSVLLLAFPEPGYVFGPAGPRVVPTVDRVPAPVEDNPRAALSRRPAAPSPAGTAAGASEEAGTRSGG